MTDTSPKPPYVVGGCALRGVVVESAHVLFTFFFSVVVPALCTGEFYGHY